MERIDVLRQYIQAELLNGSAEEVTAETQLLTSGMIDSMGVMWLIGFIEEEFGVDVLTQDVTLENFENLAAIDRYIASRS